MDNRTKITHPMDSVKVYSIDTFKEKIIAKSDFCKDFVW